MNAWNCRFTVDLSGARSRRWKSEVLSISSMVERAAVNRQVTGSSPVGGVQPISLTRGDRFFYLRVRGKSFVIDAGYLLSKDFVKSQRKGKQTFTGNFSYEKFSACALTRERAVSIGFCGTDKLPARYSYSEIRTFTCSAEQIPCPCFTVIRKSVHSPVRQGDHHEKETDRRRMACTGVYYHVHNRVLPCSEKVHASALSFGYCCKANRTSHLRIQVLSGLSVGRRQSDNLRRGRNHYSVIYRPAVFTRI